MPVPRPLLGARAKRQRIQRYGDRRNVHQKIGRPRYCKDMILRPRLLTAAGKAPTGTLQRGHRQPRRVIGNRHRSRRARYARTAAPPPFPPGHRRAQVVSQPTTPAASHATPAHLAQPRKMRQEAFRRVSNRPTRVFSPVTSHCAEGRAGAASRRRPSRREPARSDLKRTRRASTPRSPPAAPHSGTMAA